MTNFLRFKKKDGKIHIKNYKGQYLGFIQNNNIHTSKCVTWSKSCKDEIKKYLRGKKT